MKNLFLKKLLHIGILLTFCVTFYTLLDENANKMGVAIIGLVAFFFIMIGAYRNGFRLD